MRIESLETRTLLAVSVQPAAETASASGADDIAIWIHPTDPSQSKVIGAVKTSSTSVRVYNLSGQQVQSVNVSEVNNIDLRYNFPLGSERAALVAGSNRSNDSISLFRVDPQTGMLTSVAARTISTGMAIYGCAMYVSPVTGKYFVFVSSESGQLQQWELFDDGAGRVDAQQVRAFSVGSKTEGLVADDVLGDLYVGEENVGIWKYSAEPNGGAARTSVDRTGSNGNLTDDVEGLAIYYLPNGQGYLLASSQGSNEFNVYRREGINVFLGDFKLVAGGGIDAVSDTDGIDVTNFPLGAQYPQGLFVAQDNDENFKFARWDVIANALGGLVTSTEWDPRLVGAPVEINPLPGDYNRDHTVNAADYTVWRNALGETVSRGSGADGDGNGLIDDVDYTFWKDRFGNTLPATSAGTDSSRSADSRTIPNAASRAGETRLPEANSSSTDYDKETRRRPPSRRAPVTWSIDDQRLDAAFAALRFSRHDILSRLAEEVRFVGKRR